jgi:hypothetical protein
MTTIEERIDAAQTLSEYEALCSEVEGMDTVQFRVPPTFKPLFQHDLHRR